MRGVALAQHASAVRGGQHELEAVGDLSRQSSTVMRAIVLLRDSGDIERLEGVCTGAALRGVLESLGVNDRFQIKRALSNNSLIITKSNLSTCAISIAAFLRRSSMVSAESSPRRSRRERSSSQLGG